MCQQRMVSLLSPLLTQQAGGHIYSSACLQVQAGSKYECPSNSSHPGDSCRTHTTQLMHRPEPGSAAVTNRHLALAYTADFLKILKVHKPQRSNTWTWCTPYYLLSDPQLGSSVRWPQLTAQLLSSTSKPSTGYYQLQITLYVLLSDPGSNTNSSLPGAVPERLSKGSGNNTSFRSHQSTTQLAPKIGFNRNQSLLHPISLHKVSLQSKPLFTVHQDQVHTLKCQK